MKNSYLTSSHSFNSSSSQPTGMSSSAKKQSQLQLNLQKSSTLSQQQMSHQAMDSSNNNGLDSSMLSTVSSLNQSKFQFDIYINKVELVVPSPVYIFVQVLKGTHSLNTKKKLKIDQANKVASFNEKLSIVTCLNKNTGQTQSQDRSSEYQAKFIQIRLIAFYNSKEKAIGICSVDLSHFIHGQKDQNGKIAAKVNFQKCFDKNAALSFEIRAKEQFNQIRESILEEQESSSILEQDTTVFETTNDLLRENSVQDSSRFSVLENPSFLTSNEEYQTENFGSSQKSAQKEIQSKKLTQELSPTNKSKEHFDPIMRSHRNAIVQKNGKYSPSKTLNSARTIIQPSMSTQDLVKQSSQTSTTYETSSNLVQSRSQTPNLKANQESTNSNETTPSQSDSINQVRKQEDKIRKLEYEVKSLKQENQDQKQKIVTLQIKEERMREYEVKCNEADSYKQKAQSLETQLRKSQEDQQEFERDRLVIIESYEKKIHDLKVQVQDTQSQLADANAMNQQLLNQVSQLKEQNTLSTMDSAQADEDKTLVKLRNNDEFKIELSDTNYYYRDLYEKLLLSMKVLADENEAAKKSNQQLESQLIRSKEQMSMLVNELYSLEKENIYDRD
ncbi:UNKNOWN [Stylonychia lemnae]|uniref:C2 NT-type domain-containing protein n=1 Tax=Stylonychia lemnae TaxID=5949 RepID=A0A077ZX74_STYLE|nr:UNKNOWN [Stylonychia lemnae]|eukprot:CDW73131.1 UNKNOWN [Stylonychia lemnae]